LVAVRLPADKAKEARGRLRREQGSEVTAESLAMADFVVVFTTVPKDTLSAERVLELYRLRWQIELHIKRDKSIAGLNRLPNRRPDTVYT
jgi:IS4 transposase